MTQFTTWTPYQRAQQEKKEAQEVVRCAKEKCSNFSISQNISDGSFFSFSFLSLFIFLLLQVNRIHHTSEGFLLRTIIEKWDALCIKCEDFFI